MQEGLPEQLPTTQRTREPQRIGIIDVLPRMI
jgi:hypothetical protein